MTPRPRQMVVVHARDPCMSKHDHALVHVDPVRPLSMPHINRCQRSPVYVGAMAFNVHMASADQLDQSSFRGVAPVLPFFRTVNRVETDSDITPSIGNDNGIPIEHVSHFDSPEIASRLCRRWHSARGSASEHQNRDDRCDRDDREDDKPTSVHPDYLLGDQVDSESAVCACCLVCLLAGVLRFIRMRPPLDPIASRAANPSAGRIASSRCDRWRSGSARDASGIARVTAAPSGGSLRETPCTSPSGHTHGLTIGRS